MDRSTRKASLAINGRVRTGVLVALAAIFISLLLIAGPTIGTGQEKAGKPPAQWTVESHDRTNFPLIGKHRTLGCRDCHVNNVFEGTPRECEVCHWQRRQDDRYSLRLGMQCGDCHTPQDWKKVDPNRWNHETNTGFRLEGAHQALACEDCHGSGGFQPRPTDCYSCHADDYSRTDDPDHAAAQFPTSCQACHNTRSWNDAPFEHTGFVLQGRHATASCSDCHANGVYAGTSAACASCHLDDYNGTTDPNHSAAGFPLDCTQCHGTAATGWGDADFVHTGFTLQGRHATASCGDCHANGVYAGTSSACASCHLDDYNGTTDPNHSQSGYPLDCTQCHGTGATSWGDADVRAKASVTHQFPIASGRHAGLACADCHASGNIRTFGCIDCHAHEKPEMDAKHRVAGYVYNSQACYACHPRGIR